MTDDSLCIMHQEKIHKFELCIKCKMNESVSLLFGIVRRVEKCGLNFVFFSLSRYWGILMDGSFFLLSGHKKSFFLSSENLIKHQKHKTGGS